MIKKIKNMFLMLKKQYLEKNNKNMYYNKIYSFSNIEFEQKFIARTKKPTFCNYISLSTNKEGKDRIYFGKLKKNYFVVYTYPYMSLQKRWGYRITMKQHMSIWAAPVQISGNISEENGHTIIKYRIAKDDDTYSLHDGFIFISILFAIIAIVKFFLYGFSAFEPVTFLMVIIVICVFFHGAKVLVYIPKLEEEALLKFLQDLEK